MMSGTDEAKGRIDELKGQAKQALGKITDNDSDRQAGEDEAFHGRAEQAAAAGTDDLGNATSVQDNPEAKE